jgi:hypothetical protein
MLSGAAAFAPSRFADGPPSPRQTLQTAGKLDEDKLCNGIVIRNEKLPAPVFVFANRMRCAPGVDDDGTSAGVSASMPASAVYPPLSKSGLCRLEWLEISYVSC